MGHNIISTASNQTYGVAWTGKSSGGLNLITSGNSLFGTAGWIATGGNAPLFSSNIMPSIYMI